MSDTAQHLPAKPRQGLALCLSGGGFRATLFHLGTLERLNELGVLSRINDFSSVSGGSILNAVLASRWDRLVTDVGGRFANLDELVTKPVMAFCRRDLRTSTLFWQRLDPRNWGQLSRGDFSATNFLAAAYSEGLDLGQNLGQLNVKPRFIFSATHLATGVNWRFQCGGGKRAFMGDYITGPLSAEEIPLSAAVAASSAFPFAFPPLILTETRTFPNAMTCGLSTATLKSIRLSDGGVYDNLGLEPVWKRSAALLVADAGAPFGSTDSPGTGAVRRLWRSYEIQGNQALAVRKRWLISSYQVGLMKGSYWGLRSDFRQYGAEGANGYDDEIVALIALIRTDLNRFSEGEIGILRNHGYAMADVAVRRWVPALIQGDAPPLRWPAPEYAPGVPSEVLRDALAESAHRNLLYDIADSVLGRITGRSGRR